jgi:hypothetical protein
MYLLFSLPTILLHFVLSLSVIGVLPSHTSTLQATLRTAMRSFGYSHLKQSQAGIEAVNPPELDPHGWAMRSQKFTRPKERAYPHGQVTVKFSYIG